MLGLLASISFASDHSRPPEGMPFQHGLGYELFQETCSRCHGADLQGTEQGPPLLHGYYRPDHHGDASFLRAIEQGSPQHHRDFGDMPPMAGVSDDQARAIVEFIRWYQRDSGLY